MKRAGWFAAGVSLTFWAMGGCEVDDGYSYDAAAAAGEAGGGADGEIGGTSTSSGGTSRGGQGTGGRGGSEIVDGGAAGEGGMKNLAGTTGIGGTMIGGESGTGGEGEAGTPSGGTTGGGTTGGGMAGSPEAGSGGVVVAGGSGGTSASGGSPSEGGSTPVDSDPPSVLSVSPEDDAGAVLADAEIQVEFDEPMNTVSVELAYASAKLPLADVSFSWNSDDTILTITPENPLEIAEGDDPGAVVAESYSFSIGTAAEDVAGNNLATQLSSSFFTARRIIQSLPYENPGTTGMNEVGDMGSKGGAYTVDAGDTSGEGYYKGFVSIDISAVADDILELESSELHLEIFEIGGQPFANLGGFRVQHITFSTSTPTFADFTSTPLRTIPNEVGPNELPYDVPNASALLDDLANRGARNNRSQYRLEFAMNTNGNGLFDLARFDDDSSRIDVSYLIE